MKYRALSQASLSLLLCAFFWLCATTADAASFWSLYTKGKAFYKQQRYLEALKLLRQVVTQTQEGKAHFGAHFFLGMTAYQQGDIAYAQRIFARALRLSKSPRERQLVKRMSAQLRSFGKLLITPKVDPDEVGRLRLDLRAQTPFPNSQLQQIYQRIRKHWSSQGIALTSRALYLPKGRYLLSIRKTQCLRFGLAKGAQLIKQIDLSASQVTLDLLEQQSCQCGKDQVLKRQGTKVSCVCREGTAWSHATGRCEVPPAKRNWFAKNWYWIAAIGAGVAAGSVVAVYFATASPPKVSLKHIEGSVFTP